MKLCTLNRYDSAHWDSGLLEVDLCLLKIWGKLPDSLNDPDLSYEWDELDLNHCTVLHADDNNEVINAQWDTATLGTSALLCKDSKGLEQAAPVRETNSPLDLQRRSVLPPSAHIIINSKLLHKQGSDWKVPWGSFKRAAGSIAATETKPLQWV